MKIVPKNWREFQHYKDRNPPWIRLHKALLDNYEFQCLQDASRALAPMLWLIASDSTDGVIDADLGKLAFRLRRTPEWVADALKPLIDKGFFELQDGAINLLADRKQLAVPETETETETSQRTEAEKKARKRAVDRPEDVSEAVWIDFQAVRKAKKAAISDTAIAGIRREADKAGMTLQQALETCCQRGWAGFEASWLMNTKPANGKSFREQSEEFARAQFAGWAGSALKSQVIEAEADDVPRLTLG